MTKEAFETNVHLEPDTATQRLVRGETLFFPSIVNTGLSGYLKRRYGLYQHTKRTTIDGQDGILVWADDSPTNLARTTRRPFSFKVVG